MTLPLFIIRPQPAADASAIAARAMGLTPVVAPMFAVEPVAWALPPTLQYDALVIGSANALRHAGEKLGRLIHLPVYAVGSSTAALAREMGFGQVVSGIGGLQNMAPPIVAAGHRNILRLVGEEHLPLELPHTITVESRIVYRSISLPMPPDMAEQLAHPAVILLHSAVAAQHFDGQCAVHGIRRDHIRLAALGLRIADAAGTGWAAVDAAPSPDEKALLALAAQMCKTRV